MKRCAWANNDLNIPYHDKEWGVPVHDDRLLFEFLILEGAQAGLSWDTILKKRSHYRKVFDNFQPNKVARYTESKIQRLLEDPGIIRNKLKVRSAVNNAQSFLKVVKEFGSFDVYIWGFIGGQPKTNDWHSLEEIPSQTEVSSAMSKDLKKHGFNFIGSTIC